MSVHEDRRSKPLWADDIGAAKDSENSDLSDDNDASQKGMLVIRLLF